MHVKCLGRCSLIIFTVVTASLLNISTTYAQTNLEELIQYSDRDNLEEPEEIIKDITQVNLLKDISPQD